MTDKNTSIVPRPIKKRTDATVNPLKRPDYLIHWQKFKQAKD
jgi:hypothetical protein